MKRQAVVSSNIRSVGWEDDTLEVEFNNGYVYQYNNVPEAMYRELKQAASVGKYLNDKIKGSKTFRRVV